RRAGLVSRRRATACRRGRSDPGRGRRRDGAGGGRDGESGPDVHLRLLRSVWFGGRLAEGAEEPLRARWSAGVAGVTATARAVVFIANSSPVACDEARGLRLLPPRRRP